MTRSSVLVLAALLLGGLWLRLYGIDFGLPYLYDADEPLFVTAAGRMLQDRDLNPHWFGVPASTTIYMLAGLYAAIYGVGLGLGMFTSPRDVKALYYQDPTIFYLSGRIMIAIFSLAAVLLTYRIARRLFDRPTGLIAAAFLALSPLYILYSKLIRPDMQVSFLVLLVFWFCLNILQRGNWLNYSLAGFLTGLGTVSKYPAVMIAPTIVIAHVLRGARQYIHLQKLLLSGAASILGALIASPFLFLDLDQTLSDVSYEARSTHLSATGAGLLPNVGWYVSGPLVDALSTVGLVLAAVGIVQCIASKQRERWLLLTFPVIFTLFIASLHLRWARWIIPTIPFFCMLAAHGLLWMASQIGERWDRRIGIGVGVILLLLVAGPLMREAVVQSRELSGTDTRTLARQWMMRNIPPGSTILVEAYTPQFPRELHTFLSVMDDGSLVKVDTKHLDNAVYRPKGRIGRLRNIAALYEQGTDYMVLSNYYDRYVDESSKSDQYNEIRRTYEELIRMGTAIYEVSAIPGENTGPTIRVYRMPKAR